MPSSQPAITIHQLIHREVKVIAISFDYDRDIIEQIKTLNGRKYSASNQCWYVPYTKEAFADFCKLRLPYQIKKNTTSKTIRPSGHAQDSLPDKHQSANGENSPRQSEPVEHREQESTSDIFRAEAGKIVVQFSRKYFYLSVSYEEAIIQNIKKLNRVWWNKNLKQWICLGSLANLELMQEMFSCWSDQQMEQLQIMIGAYERPKRVTLYRLPDQHNKIAIELRGYGIDHQYLSRISKREHQKSRNRWIIDNDTSVIKRLIDYYTAHQVEVINRLPTEIVIHSPQERSNQEKQQYLLTQYSGSSHVLVQKMSDVMIQQRYSWKSIKAYCVPLVKFNIWLGSKTIADSTLQDVQGYLTDLSKQKVSNSLLNTHVSALKFYYGKVVNRPDLSQVDIKRPRKVFNLPRILSKQEVARMIEVTTNLKHRTILYALYASGLRLGELLNLRLDDIKWDRNQIFISQAKGKKDRVVMLSDVLKSAMNDYCASYKPVHYLFEGTLAGKSYSPQSVQKVVKKAALLANISQKVTPHTLRHCFATHLHDGGTSIKLIQELLGHKDIKTTMIYTHVSTKQVTSVISPLDVLHKKDNLGLRKGGDIT